MKTYTAQFEDLSFPVIENVTTESHSFTIVYESRPMQYWNAMRMLVALVSEKLGKDANWIRDNMARTSNSSEITFKLALN